MKLVKRASLFETNSSSVHALCIGNDTYSIEDLPKVQAFYLREYGWEEDTLCSPEEKASYLWTAVCYYYGSNYYKGPNSVKDSKNFIEEVLNSHNIHAEFEDPNKCDDFYIDHVDRLSEWLDVILSDADKLMCFLYSENSMVITGNDNSYDEDDNPAWTDVPKGCNVYMKGN